MKPEKTIGILSLPQREINRQLYQMILKLQAENGGDSKAIGDLEDAVDDIESAIGADDKATTIKGRLYALEHPAQQGTG